MNNYKIIYQVNTIKILIKINKVKSPIPYLLDFLIFLMKNMKMKLIIILSISNTII